MAGFVPGADGSVSDRRNGRVLVVEVELAWGSLLKQLAAAVTKKLVEANLDFKGLVGSRLVEGLLLVLDERNLLVGCFRAENIAERNVLETEILSDVVVVGNVDTRRYPVRCQIGYSDLLILALTRYQQT